MTDGRTDPEQAWFWTREWQQREEEADEDLAFGRVTRFESDEEFLAALDERTPLDADTQPAGTGSAQTAARGWLSLISTW